MKLTFLILLVTFMHLGASVYSQQTRLSISLRNVTVRDVLKQIEDQSDFFFMYKSEEVDVFKSVNIQAENRPIEEVLDNLFRETGISYEIINRQIVLSPGSKAGHLQVDVRQQRPVSGKVTDTQGIALPGVTVVVKGTTTGMITDYEGNFSLTNVSSDATLVFSFVGMRPHEVQVGNRSTINASLQEESIDLEEVVAVGYGVQKKVNLSGSVASVNVSELTESRPIVNLSNALTGMAAGISVTSGNNRPGNDDATILIRGQGTLNTSTPLIIIDGVESLMNSVNPQDVESISVLKDAASAAIYGSRAANGVVLITTKTGKAGTLKMDYHGYISFESIRKTLTPVSNYADYMEYINEGLSNSKLATVFSQDMIDAWRNGNDPLKYPNTDWIDATFNTSTGTNHVVSVTGGSDRIRFYTSFGFLDNPGVTENTGEKKYTARLNIESDVRSWLTLGVNISGYFSELHPTTDEMKSFDDSGAVFTYAAATTPGMVFRHPDGRYGGMNNAEDDAQSAINNPLRRLNSVRGSLDKHHIRTRFTGTVRPLDGLSIAGSFTYNFTDEQLEKMPVFINLWSFLTNTITTEGTGKTYVNNKNSKVIRHFGDIVARYENRFFDNRLDVGVMAGASQEQYLSKNFQTTKYDLVDPSLSDIDAATGDASASGSSTDWAMRSWFGRINLGWNNKYLLEFNMRGDASSRFLEGNRWGYFPSGSVAWRIDQESFMDKLTAGGALTQLKLRVSYGSLGNNSVGNYDAQSSFAQSNYVWGNAVAVGLAQTSLANANLTWETTSVTNIGIDFGVLRNRLTGTIDAFQKKTKDILIDLPAPYVHGSSSIPKQNSATVSNKGVELTLGWLEKRDGWNYSITGNFTYNKNKVEKFKGDDYSLSGVNYIKEGYPIKAQYMLRVDRILQTDEDIAIVEDMIANKSNAFAAYGKPAKGDLLYKDTNDDGLINAEDREIVSDGNNPKFLFGVNSNVSWKGFDLGVLVQGVADVKVYWQHAAYNTPTVRYGYQLNKEIVEGRWYEGRTDASYPRLIHYSDTKNTQASDFYLENKAYVKIRNIQLGYTLPQRLSRKIYMDRFRLYGTLENFITFTSYKGFDPEVSGMAYPTIKQAVIGVNITF